MLGKNGASSSKVRTLGGKSIPVPSPPDSGTTLPHLKPQDNSKILPKIHTALSRPQDSYLPTEDLDGIQLELENLLSTVALRYRYLKAEYEILDKAEERRDKKGKFMEKDPSSPGKRKKFDEKNKRDGPSKIMLSGQSKISKLKPHQVNSPAQHTDDSLDDMLQYHGNQKDNPKLSLPRNDTPNKFWLSVEPYCMPLTHEDIRLLDDLIEEYSDNLIPPIPELGPHFTDQWANDDIKDEHYNKNKSRLSTVSGLVKKSERPMGDNVTGPLTQRLVSALMEENLMPDNVTTSAENSNSGSDNTSSDFVSNRSSLLSLKNGICIERRVRKELIDQGILDPDDFPRDDEILSEIKRVRTELSAIAEYNGNELKKLYNLAKDEMRRLELKRKLDSIDQEIIETYKRNVAAKQKRRELTKQERDDIFRLTEEQKKVSDQLEAMLAPGLNILSK
ncbi:transcriptional adapter 3 [Lutzomyia longipalpis]|uniref:transcriptional adapter 3 n=1 Tax=Lutzomyia longipalpis TaxID=7200 RepID=UPI002484192A|nr:transcriptional adapter 3 [Lutzomyia longipalpis]